MNEWALILLRLGILLLLIGLAPLAIFVVLWPEGDPLVPGLLSISVAPLGMMVTLAGAILYLWAWLRRRP